MTIEMKLFLKNSVKYDIIFGMIASAVIYVGFGKNVSFIYFFGILVSIINFIVSGVILDKSLNGQSKVFRFLFPISYVIRILCVASIALFFVKDVSYIIAYLGGFISHFPIIIFSFIRMQKKGSE